MKIIPFHKNLPTLIDKQNSLNSKKSTLVSSQSSCFNFATIKLLILHTNSLPLLVTLKGSRMPTIFMKITPTMISLQADSISRNLPLQIHGRAWIKMELGSEPMQVEVQGIYKQNKLLRSYFYTKEKNWRDENTNQSQLVIPLALEPWLSSIRKQLQDIQTINRQSISKIGGVIRAKLSLRTNSSNSKQQGSTQLKESSLCTPKKSYSEQLKRRGQSGCLTFNMRTREERCINSSDRLKAKSFKVAKKEKEVIGLKLGDQSYVPSFLDKQCEAYSRSRKHPRFYQQPSFTLEQIELKRKKFDSQWSPHFEEIGSITKTQQSEVVQEIIRIDNSLVACESEDNFEERMKQETEDVQLASEQSGTLCQSVFQ